MKPPPFRYLRPETLEQALAALAEHGDDAKALAGGQSLIPMLNFRLARPGVLIDIARLPELNGIERRDGELVIGAAVPQARAERSAEVAEACPLMRQALAHVGHPQIRARGTIGGSLAHADAAAELAAVAVALDATLVVRGPEGVRNVPAGDFFLGPWMTSMAATELLVEVRVPELAGARTAFVELARRRGDFAVAGVAVATVTDPASGTLAEVRLAAIGIGMRPQRLEAAERSVLGKASTAVTCADAGVAAAAEVNPLGDRVKGDAGYRREVLSALVTRGLEEVAA